MQSQSRYPKFAAILLTIICIIQSAVISYLAVDYIHHRVDIGQSLQETRIEPVNVCIIDKRSFTGYIYTYGQIKSKNFVNIKLPYFHGYNPKVSKINFKAGSKVKAGDVLMEFKCPELYYKAEATAKEAEQKKLYYNKLVNLKSATSTYEVSRAMSEYEKCALETEIMQESVKNLKILAPFNGIASKPEVNIDEMPDSNKILFSIHDQDCLMVEFYVDNSELTYIGIGTKIVIENIDINAEKHFVAEASVNGINPYVDEQTGKVKVIAEINKDYLQGERTSKCLKHNMHVYIYFDKKPLKDVFIVTKSAIVEDGNNHTYVRKIINNNGQDEIQMIRVNTLDHNHNIYAIKSEQLKNGDQVVIEGGSKRDGQPVIVKKIFEL